MNNGTQPTMKDVARVAGVSLGTVSRVFNGYEVGEDYRRRVEEAAEKLGYQVNSYARGLKLNRSFNVALLLPSLRHPFFAILADELTAVLSRKGYRAVLMITNYDPDAEQKCFTLAQQNKVDGIIALSYSSELEVDSSLPVVTIDRHFGGCACVASDNFRGGQLAAEKLMALGCRRLLFLRIGPSIRGEVDRRGPGFEDACNRAGVPYESLVVDDIETEAPIYRFLDSHIHDGVFDFDGVFCNTDGLNLRVCRYLAEHGIRVPEDVQAIGYDGIPDFASGEYICSTIVQPVSRMAEKAVELLLDKATDSIASKADSDSGSDAASGSPILSADASTGYLLHSDASSAGSLVAGTIYRLPVAYAAGGTTREPRTTTGSQPSPHIFDPFRRT